MLYSPAILRRLPYGVSIPTPPTLMPRSDGCFTYSGNCVTWDQASRQPFLKGDGFDLYIDLGGGMPYPCTVSKVVVRVIGNAGEQVYLQPPL